MTKSSLLFLSILRIAIGLLFIQHGTQKLFTYPPPSALHPAHVATDDSGKEDLAAKLAPYSGMVELGGGALMIVGFLTRIAAFILAGEMAVAYYAVHFHNGPFPINNGGELAVLYCITFLVFVITGGGSLSVDDLLFKK